MTYLVLRANTMDPTVSYEPLRVYLPLLEINDVEM